MSLWQWLFQKEPGEERQKEQIVQSIETVIEREMRVLEDVKETNMQAHDKLQELIEEMRQRHKSEGRMS